MTKPKTTGVSSFYERMTPQQRAELDEGIAQAERGQVLPADEVFDRLAKRFGFSLKNHDE
jgi:predicted transcriptional regulator